MNRLNVRLHLILLLWVSIVAPYGLVRADSAMLDSELISLRIQSHALTTVPGGIDTISIFCNSRGTGIAGFDLTLAYDHEVFDLLDALPGNFLDSCQWEYFMGRDNPKCPGPCPGGLYKIVALARFQNQDNATACFVPPGGAEIVKLVIRRRPEMRAGPFMGVVSEPLRFFWIDCGDNSVASVSGNDLFLRHSVSDADGAPLPQNIFTQFPNYTGPPDSCFDSRRENAPKSRLKFINAVIVAPPIEFVPAPDSAGNQ